MYEAGARPDVNQQAAHDSAEKFIHGVTGGKDIEFNAEGVKQLLHILGTVRDKFAETGRHTGTSSVIDAPNFDPVAMRFYKKQNDWHNNHLAPFERKMLDSVDKTVDLLHKIVKDYESREDDEARKFRGLD